jgi:hypothetical protein
VAINEWDSLEQAHVFYNSKAWKDLAPQHNKAQKLTRLYAVEAIKKVGRFRTRQSRKRDPARTEEVSTASHVLATGRPFDSDRVIVCVIF